MIKILLLCISLLSLCASIEQEVEDNRFLKENGTIIDKFSGIEYQKASKYNIWEDANDYCENLNLNNKNDWHLPTIVELRSITKIKHMFPSLDERLKSGKYWMHTNFNSIRSGSVSLYRFKDNASMQWVGGSRHTKCVRGIRYENKDTLATKIYHERNKKRNKIKKRKRKTYDKLTKIEFKKAEIENTINSYNRFINKYKLSNERTSAYLKLYKLVKNKNDISIYGEFLSNYDNKEFPNAPQIEAISKIYNLIKQKNNIVGYEWFLKKYPKSKHTKEAISTIHRLAFEKAKEINTVSAYNTFVYAYPIASQVRDANDAAYKLEVQTYTDLGMFGGFFEKEAKLEKKARKLLIKAKQIERNAQEYRGNAKAGYIIVTNRMYDLLQEKFDDSDATLRHLESQEFKDFVRTFKSVMNDIKRSLNRIQNNTSNLERYAKEMVNISVQGFADSKADREMTAYHEKKKTEWDKFMHFRDTGYN